MTDEHQSVRTYRSKEVRKMQQIFGKIITQSGIGFPAVWYPETFNNEPDNFKTVNESYSVAIENHTEDPHFIIQEASDCFIFKYDGTCKVVSAEEHTGMEHIFRSL